MPYDFVGPLVTGLGIAERMATRKAAKDTAGRKLALEEAEAPVDIDLKKAQAEWLRRREPGSKGGSGNTERIRALGLLLKPLNDKLKAGDELNEDEAATFNSAGAELGDLSGTAFTPIQPKVGLGEKMTRFAGRAASAVGSGLRSAGGALIDRMATRVPSGRPGALPSMEEIQAERKRRGSAMPGR